MSALLVGYARCSTDQQDLTAQRDALTQFGVEAERIYVDHGLNAALRDAGLTSLTWTVAALTGVAGLPGRRLDLLEHDGFAVTSDDLAAIRAVLPTAQKISDRNGVAAPGQVLDELAAGGHTPDPGVVRGILTTQRDVTWLTGDWFWFQHAAGRNRLVNTSLRILAVHEPQTLVDMAGGLERHYTWRNSTGGAAQRGHMGVPPQDVVGAFYASHPAFTVDGHGHVSAATPADPQTLLGPEKLAMVAVLREQPWSAMSRNDLIAACTAEGMQIGTVQVFLTYAECITNHGHNVWGLRGMHVPGPVVRRLQDTARGTARAFDKVRLAGISPRGRPWFAQRLTPPSCTPGGSPPGGAITRAKGVASFCSTASTGKPSGACDAAGTSPMVSSGSCASTARWSGTVFEWYSTARKATRWPRSVVRSCWSSPRTGKASVAYQTWSAAHLRRSWRRLDRDSSGGGGSQRAPVP